MRLLPLFLLLAACAAPSRGERDASAWVWILTGPGDAEVQGDARAVAFAGHFANMERLAEQGELLLAGPFGEPRARDDHRGIFVLAAQDLDRARAIAETDPAARAGVFVFEVERFQSADALERLTPMHAAAVAATGVEDPPPGFHSRSYVLVAGKPAGAAERALAEAPVLFAGRLGAGTDERALFCLDATTADEAAALLPDGVAWTVMPWFATAEVANLRVNP